MTHFLIKEMDTRTNTYSTIAGVQLQSMVVSGNPVSKADGWRKYLDQGNVKHVSVAGLCVPTTPIYISGFRRDLFEGTPRDFQLKFDDGTVMQGKFRITAVGNHTNAGTFLQLESDGPCE